MGRFRGMWLLLCAVLLFVAAPGGSAAKEEAVPRMTKEELKGRLGSPDLAVLDVRLGGEEAPARIPGAVFGDPDRVDAWASRYPKDRTIVVYCA